MHGIVVLGATGNQGSAVLQHLHAWKSAHPDENLILFAVTRDPSDMRAIQVATVFAGVEMIKADLEDKESLKAAFALPRERGATAVSVFALTTPCLASGGYATNPEEESKAGVEMIEAMKEAGVDACVFSSAANCHEEESPAYIKSKLPVEKALKLSGIAFTIFRPVTFIEVWDRVHPVCNGRVVGMVPGDVELQMLSTKDLGGAAALSLINKGKHNGEIIDLAGDKCSGKQLAESLSKMRNGQKFTYHIAWLTRIIIYFFAPMVYDERVRFPIEKGGFKADMGALSKISNDFPECFNRKGPLTYARILLSLGYDKRTLPTAKGVGITILQYILLMAGCLGVLAFAGPALLPETVWEDLKRRWAFYGLCLLLAAGMILQALSRKTASS